MANNYRKNQRRIEIAQLVLDGRIAHQTGKPRSSVPWKPFQSTNGAHWLKGWDIEEQERLNSIQRRKENQHARLLEAIDLFEASGDRMTLASVLRVIAGRLPPTPHELTDEDYTAIYGWGGQG